MRHHIENLFNYRRYIWNRGLGLWNDMYDESVILEDKTLRPNDSKVRNELVENKDDWQYALSSRVLQQTISDLDKAWKNYFNPNMTNHDRPNFKSKKNYSPTFTTDRARIVNNKLRLDKPNGIPKSNWYPIKLSENIRFDGDVKLVTIAQKVDGLYASIVVDANHAVIEPEMTDICGVDANVKRFNYNDGNVEYIVPSRLDNMYDRIGYYQKCLAVKRVKNPRYKTSNRYAVMKTKLQKLYQDVYNLQMDILHKFTTKLVRTYSEIHIEDLNVNAMKMSSIMGKNLHRSMFGKFKELLTYKCSWNHRILVLVDRYYPSTQTCSECGYVKTKDSYGGKQTLSGDSIYHQHQVYRCYECGTVKDRDENAVQNIINYGLVQPI